MRRKAAAILNNLVTRVPLLPVLRLFERESGNEVTILNTVFKVKNWARSCKVAGNLRSASILVSLCSPLLLTDVTQAFVTFWYTQRYTTTQLTRKNLPESTNVTIHAVSPVLFSRKAKQITFLPQLMNKEKLLTWPLILQIQKSYLLNSMQQM